MKDYVVRDADIRDKYDELFIAMDHAMNHMNEFLTTEAKAEYEKANTAFLTYQSAYDLVDCPVPICDRPLVRE